MPKMMMEKLAMMIRRIKPATMTRKIKEINPIKKAIAKAKSTMKNNQVQRGHLAQMSKVKARSGAMDPADIVMPMLGIKFSP
jgi:hypothetical protein